MTSRKLRLQHLLSLAEAELRTEVIMPLLMKMGYKDVRERHGAQEFGKDITFVENSPLGERHFAIVAKAGDLSGAASGKSNLQTVRTQVTQAFEMAYEDIEHRRPQQVTDVIVWLSGQISHSAQRQILALPAIEYRNVSFFDGNKTIDLLEEHYPAYFTLKDPIISDYYAGAKQFFGRIEDLRTLGTSSDAVSLPAIFVPPVFRRFRRKLKLEEAEKDAAMSYADVLAATTNTVITGQMGAGKSTVLRRLLLDVIEKNEATNSAKPIPVFVRFKALALDNPRCVEDALNREFERYSTMRLTNGLSEMLAQGSVIALLDGLDELRDPGMIELAVERVLSLTADYPRVRVLLSTREVAILARPDLFPGFQILDILELKPEQMDVFVVNWFGKKNPIGLKLSRFLRDPLNLHGLPNTPMTLALVAILHASGSKEMPANLTDLFAKYVELALGRWDEGKDVSLQIEWKLKEFFLRGIAWELHSTKELSLSKSHLEAIVNDLSAGRGLANIDTGLFGQEIADRAQLLIPVDGGELEFKHRAFQEYFTGLEINAKAEAAKFIVERFEDDWWAQAIFFACGLKPDTDEYLDAIMSSTRGKAASAFWYAINLGYAVQATYLSSRETKRLATDRVLDALLEAWPHIASEMKRRQAETPELEGMAIGWLLVLMFGVAARESLGSITLAAVLEDAAEEMAQVDLDALPEDEQNRLSLRAFLLAAACANCDLVDTYVELFGGALLRNPILRAVAIPFTRELESRPWLKPASRRKVQNLVKKLDKARKLNKESIDRAIHSDWWLALPAPNVDGATTGEDDPA